MSYILLMYFVHISLTTPNWQFDNNEEFAIIVTFFYCTQKHVDYIQVLIENYKELYKNYTNIVIYLIYCDIVNQHNTGQSTISRVFHLLISTR